MFRMNSFPSDQHLLEINKNAKIQSESLLIRQSLVTPVTPSHGLRIGFQQSIIRQYNRILMKQRNVITN